MYPSWKQTYITLISKKINPFTLTEFRLINLYNIIYKLVSSILMNMLKSLIKKLVFLEQEVFIPGSNIMDGILLVQSLCTPSMLFPMLGATWWSRLTWIKGLRLDTMAVLTPCVAQLQSPSSIHLVDWVLCDITRVLFWWMANHHLGLQLATD